MTTKYCSQIIFKNMYDNGKMFAKIGRFADKYAFRGFVIYGPSVPELFHPTG